MKIKEFTSLVLDQIGFDSIMEIPKNAIAWKYKLTAVYLFSVSSGAIITGIEQYTEKFVYTPALGMLILWATTILDIILGMSASVHMNNGVSPNRLGRAFVRLITQTALVALFYHMSHAWSMFIASWMVDSLLIVFTLSTFYSVIGNAKTLDLITKDQFDFIEGIVNVKKLIDRFKSKK